MTASLPPFVAADSLVVVTNAGAVQGVANGTVVEWRGIPYAAPPVGTLRWRPPQPVASWPGIRDATTFAAPCIQLTSDTATRGSEDCLYLNVFAPAVTSTSGLPVMVHLHPGGNAFGAGYEEAGALVNRGVIVVTLNYRLGVFGWVGHPALSAEGSLPEQGLLDQIAALHWVRDNIAAFGGDAGNVTLFGMSAGSFDTVALAASPLAAGLFHRAAAESAAFWSATGVGQTLADHEALGIESAAYFGCEQAADVAACLRSLPASWLVLAGGFLDVGPLVGGTVLPRPALEVFEADGAGVPLLIGSNREEAGWFYIPFFEPLRKGAYVRSVSDLMGAQKTAAALKLYPARDYESLEWNLVTMTTDAIYTCPTRRLALAASTHNPTYRYLYTHIMDNDPDQAAYRAGHSFEDPFLWRHFYPLMSGEPYQPTAAEEALSATMSSYWTNFAKTGDPNGPGLPTWPTYDPANERYQVMDDVVQSAAKYQVAQCGLMDALSSPFPTCTSLCRYYTVGQGWHRFRDEID